MINYIDLFAGAGGLSEGFSDARYNAIAHVEMNKDACYTLKTRACYRYLKNNNNSEIYRNYLKGQMSRNELYEYVPTAILDSVICETMSQESMKSIYKKINEQMNASNVKRIDLVIGGPPCQAYSLVGRSRKCMDKDPRNELYTLYLDVLKKYKPQMFVFENVPGMLTAGDGCYFKAAMGGFRDLGYNCDYEVVDASDYGVLQRRKRIIVVGWKTAKGINYPSFEKCKGNYTVKMLFEDLPVLNPGEGSNKYKKRKINDYLLNFGIRTDKDILTWHIARPNIERDRQIYERAISEWNNGHKRLKYDNLPKELITHNNTKGFLDRYKVVADDLPTAHTMMAHISKDGHYYIHPDIRQARSITVREAARIQSFPDNYYFEGSRTSAFTQIGNAVPPLMARAIANAVYVELVKKRRQV